MGIKMSFKSQLCAAILTLGCSSLTANAMVGNDADKENKIQHYQPSAENLESRKQFQDESSVSSCIGDCTACSLPANGQ